MIRKTAIIIAGFIPCLIYSQQSQLQQVFSNSSLINQGARQAQSVQVFASNVGNAGNQAKVIQNNSRRSPSQTNYSNVSNQMVQPLVNMDQIQANTPLNRNQSINLQQQANVAMPQIQTGNAKMNVSFNLPKVELSWNRKIKKTTTSSKSKRINLVRFQNKLKKMNRKLLTKLGKTKQLRIKVDDCFKW